MWSVSSLSMKSRRIRTIFPWTCRKGRSPSSACTAVTPKAIRSLFPKTCRKRTYVGSVGVAVTNPDDCLAALAQIRDAAEQRAFISQTEGSPTQSLLEAISDKIRELLPRDPDLAQSLPET